MGWRNDLWNGEIELLGVVVITPGVRITMWLAAVIIIAAGVLASWSLKAGGLADEPLLTDEAEVRS